MIFRQIHEEGLAQMSYLLGCAATGEALVVDPRRDVDVYLELAQSLGLRITAIAETHIHADYLSGARELARATGATLYLSDEGDENWKYKGLEGFPHVLLKDGDEFKVGNIRVRAVHTPGHTPEHLSFLVADGAVTDEPLLFLTGDFVFVGDVGRPDLLEEAAGIKGTAEPGARRMFRSLKEKFLTLPDHVQVWPGHGAGSACGKALGALPATTVGYERRHAWWAEYLERDDEEGFVKALLQGQPEAPTYFREMKRLNRDGMAILGGLPHPGRLTQAQFERWLREGAILVDTRDKFAFAGGHIPGSINIPAGKNFSTWAGWLLPSSSSPDPRRWRPSPGPSSASAWTRWWGTSRGWRATPKASWKPSPRSPPRRPRSSGRRGRPSSWTCAGGTSTSRGTSPGPKTSTRAASSPTWTGSPRTGPSSSTAWAGTAPAPPSAPSWPTVLETP